MLKSSNSNRPALFTLRMCTEIQLRQLASEGRGKHRGADTPPQRGRPERNAQVEPTTNYHLEETDAWLEASRAHMATAPQRCQSPSHKSAHCMAPHRQITDGELLQNHFFNTTST